MSYFLSQLHQAKSAWQNGQGQVAWNICQELSAKDPHHPDLLQLQGVLLWHRGQIQQGLECLKSAAERGPSHWPELHLNLGLVYRQQGQLRQAIYWLQRSLKADTQQAEAHYALGNLYAEMGDQLLAQQAFNQAVSLEPDQPRFQTTRLFNLVATPGLSHLQRLEIFKAAHRHQQVPLPAISSYPHQRDPERRLRIGYISADFRQHVAAYSLRPLFELADRQAFTLVAYNMAHQPDEWTQWFKQQADEWLDIHQMDDLRLLERIRQDQIDILIDCSGHTVSNRLQVMKYKPAPIQLSAFGFLYTTGLAAIDYQFTDEAAIPADCQDWYSESLIYLSSQMHWQPYDPAMLQLEAAPPPVLSKGFITFGSGNASYKLNPEVIKLWAAILLQVPDSRLILKHRRFEHPDIQQHFLEAFQQHGVRPERLSFKGSSSSVEHLAFYQELDIALDPFPYTGGVTSCETLYMGVPLITLTGDVTRTSLSVLKLLGLEELIAQDAKDYFDKAVELAQSLPRLSAYRAELRTSLLQSPITQSQQFVDEIEEAYRQIWQLWCAEA